MVTAQSLRVSTLFCDFHRVLRVSERKWSSDSAKDECCYLVQSDLITLRYVTISLI